MKKTIQFRVQVRAKGARKWNDVITHDFPRYITSVGSTNKKNGNLLVLLRIGPTAEGAGEFNFSGFVK